MFLKGKKYANGEGAVFEVVMHLAEGEYPILAKDVKTGLMEKFRRNGELVRGKPSKKDLIDAELQ